MISEAKLPNLTVETAEKTIDQKATVYSVIDWCRETAESEADKGTKFERATRFYLKNDPLWQARFDEVWMWKDAPTNNGHDIGIDLVARDAEDGSYWAIQCKCYDERSTLDYQTVSTFYGATGNKGAYGHNMLVSTTEHISSHLDQVATEWGTVRLFPSEMSEADIDWDAFLDGRSTVKRELYDPRPHQRIAIDDCIKGFEENDRGKLIMACGTGKTLTSLRLAEEMLPPGSLVLFCAPSISLVGQTLRVWANQAKRPLKCAVVCSDAKASDAGVDAWESSLRDLPYPATTDPNLLYEQMNGAKAANPDGLNVVFSTYQSIQVISDAQALGLNPFDLIICDEAHRTTGAVEAAGSKEDMTEFVKVHDNSIVSANKRLYMTATPRIYGDVAKRRAKAEDYEVSSMDDESVYGPEFHRLTFGQAVDQGLLSDYKVIVLKVDEEAISGVIQRALAEEDDFDVPEVAKIIGCWKGLADQDKGEQGHPLKNAVAFCSTIAESKRMRDYFGRVVDAYIEQAREQGDEDVPTLHCDIRHVDGTMDAAERKQDLKWLADADGARRKDGDPTCRILTNARCLSEGIDVPNLDAVMFLQPKKSQVDVVQAVGRVMRRFEGKDFGYIILPVVIPAGMDAEQALDANEPFQVVWDILKALRSHDERLEARVNALPYDGDGKDSPVSVVDVTPDGDGDQEEDGSGEQMRITFTQHELQRAVDSMIVKKCGTKVYWDEWAKDIAAIAKRHIERIRGLVGEGDAARAPFETFLRGLRDSLNDSITEDAAVEMLAQHMITLPVFEALFGGSGFAQSNPVSQAMGSMIDALQSHRVVTEDEERELHDLYRSVEIRAESVKTDAGRQRIIKELYEKFFSQAFKATSEKMGIVYTPDEIVDYILHATDRMLFKEFGRHLADEGVHVLDPFTGTGTFIVDLINDEDLMPADKLAWKYQHELHANEIVLLAYYIATINIEQAYHARVGEGAGYAPFPGAVLTDTFQMYEEGDPIDRTVFVGNSKRIDEQMELPIRVIVGNPPYSAGQRSANDNNANEHYPTLERRIRETYVSKTQATLRNSLYDSYIEAFRWASDRIGDEGIVCFVSNAGWLRSEAGAGVRRCFIREFNSVYVFDLLGNARTQGEERRKQSGNVFGAGTRTPVSITMLVKNPKSAERGAIHYHCVGEYLSQEEKLSAVSGCIDADPEWEILEQDRHGDWLDQRDDSWYRFVPMGINKFNVPSGIFTAWSAGVKTQRDAWCWNFSLASLRSNIKRLVNNTNEEIAKSKGDINRLTYDPKYFSWTRAMRGYAARMAHIPYFAERYILGAYRPYCKQILYCEPHLNEVPALQQKLFPIVKPNETAENVVIALTTGNNYSCLVSNCLPDLHFVGDSQCFPLYWYEKDEGSLLGLVSAEGEKVVRDAWGNRYVRHEAITDEALSVFRSAYPNVFAGRAKKDGGMELSKEDIFYYVYGILHSPEYCERFAANLQRELPRIPLVSAFREFSMAGRALADLHLNYESVDPWPLTIRGNRGQYDIAGLRNPGPVRKMKWGRRRDPETGKRENDYTTLVYNDNLTYADIPERANDYKVNGRSPLEWMVDRYQVKTDKATAIVNDPNEYSDDPAYICNLVPRLVTVSMRTLEIIESLPSLKEIAKPANWPAAWKAEM